MTELFTAVVNMSVTSAYVIAALAVIRLLMKRAPKRYSYLLWSAAGFRLICPVSFASVISIFNAGLFNMTKARSAGDAVLHYIPPDIGHMASPQVTVGIPAANTIIAESLPAAPPVPGAGPLQPWITAGAIVWLAVLAAFLIYGAVSYLRLKSRVSAAVLAEDGVCESGAVRSPFVLGFVKPKIYVPFGLGAQERAFILRHERCHIRRRDYLIKPLAFLLLAVHWFNPLVWLAFVLMARDMEMSCDEKVLSEAGPGLREDYGASLVSFAAGRRFPGAGPLAFGESDVRGRVKNVLRFKKPRPWITAAAAVFCLAVITACAANPNGEKDAPGISQLYGTYDYEDTVYTWPFSSFLAVKGDMPAYTLSEKGLTIKAPEETQEIPASYTRHDFDEAEFKTCFDDGLQVPDVSSYKERCYFSDDDNEKAFRYPVYRVYLMDGEVWLASLAGRSGGALRFGSIYLLSRTEEETTAAQSNYSNLGISVPLPEDYAGKVTLTPPDRLDHGVIIEAYHQAAGAGGGGFMFSISRHTPAEFEDYWVGNFLASGITHFAQDGGYYYSCETMSSPFQYNIENETEYLSLMDELTSYIIPELMRANGLTAYDHSTLERAQFTYPGRHGVVTVNLSGGGAEQLILSQPIRQGDGGIWCVDRFVAPGGTLCPVLPDTDKLALDYYGELQEKSDGEVRPAPRDPLLDPGQVAADYVRNVWGTAYSSIHIAFIPDDASYGASLS
jgi:beta-lactamase regulating signal transducer with metallopeptidase domain